MIAHIFTIVALAAAASASSVENQNDKNITTQFSSLQGVDPNTLSCDAAGHVFLLLPHFTDCSKFYMCAHGVEVEMSCAPGGLIFDFVQQTCNWAWAIECRLRTPKEDVDIEGSGIDEGDIGIFGEEVENGPIGILTGDSSGTVRPVSALTSRLFIGAINCNRADAASHHIPYKGDCQKYWKCVSGVPQSFYCSDGLYFNDITQQCDHEANVKCNEQIEDELQGEFLEYK